MKYFEAKNSQYSLIAQWLNAAHRKQIPRVVLKTRYKYANLEWDCIALEPQRQKCLQQRLFNLQTGLRHIFHRYGTEGHSRAVCLGPTGQLADLDVDQARYAAAEVYNLLEHLSDPEAELDEEELQVAEAWGTDDAWEGAMSVFPALPPMP